MARYTPFSKLMAVACPLNSVNSCHCWVVCGVEALVVVELVEEDVDDVEVEVNNSNSTYFSHVISIGGLALVMFNSIDPTDSPQPGWITFVILTTNWASATSSMVISMGVEVNWQVDEVYGKLLKRILMIYNIYKKFLYLIS